MNVKWFSIYVIILAVLVSIFAPHVWASELCPVNWGNQPTYATGDGGCKFGPADQDILGGVPEGYYGEYFDLDHEAVQIATEGMVGFVREITLRPVTPGYNPKATQPMSVLSPEVTWTCPNWGDKPTVVTPDNGCYYEGPRQGGTVPEGWYANTDQGDKKAGDYIEVVVITLRPVASFKVISQSDQPVVTEVTQTSQQTSSSAECGGINYPVTPKEVVCFLGGQSDAQYWHLEGNGPGWHYEGPLKRFTVPNKNVVLDHPRGRVNPGDVVETTLATLWPS